MFPKCKGQRHSYSEDGRTLLLSITTKAQIKQIISDQTYIASGRSRICFTQLRLQAEKNKLLESFVASHAAIIQTRATRQVFQSKHKKKFVATLFCVDHINLGRLFAGVFYTILRSTEA